MMVVDSDGNAAVAAEVERLARQGTVPGVEAHPAASCAGLRGGCPVCRGTYERLKGDPPNTARCGEASCVRAGRFARFGGLDLCPAAHAVDVGEAMRS